MSAVLEFLSLCPELTLNPPEGIVAGPMNEENFFEWEALIMGPEDTCFEFGVFPAILSFPLDYPLSPPKMRFTCEMFHPNRSASPSCTRPATTPWATRAAPSGGAPCRAWRRSCSRWSACWQSPMMKAEPTWMLPKCGGTTVSSSTGLPSRLCRSPWGSETRPAHVRRRAGPRWQRGPPAGPRQPRLLPFHPEQAFLLPWLVSRNGTVGCTCSVPPEGFGYCYLSPSRTSSPAPLLLRSAALSPCSSLLEPCKQQSQVVCSVTAMLLLRLLGWSSRRVPRGLTHWPLQPAWFHAVWIARSR
ncbi:ubiquitin-conjugating enzyme E2 G2 isoform 2-T2 [Thomomys bottae]